MVGVAADKKRGTEVFSDMVRSLAVVFAFILIGFAALIPRGHRTVHVIDPAPTLVQAQRAAAYHVVVPTGLAAGWRPTSARTEGGTAGVPLHVHVGYVTPDTQYAAVEESDAPARDFVAGVIGARGSELPTITLNGATWQQRRAGNGDFALVRTTGRMTVVVTGSARPPELVTLATALH